MFYKINPTEHTNIVNYYREGLTIYKIAEKYNCTATQILTILNKYNVEIRSQKKLNNEQEKELISKYQEGYKTKQLSEMFGLSISIIIKWLRRNNIDIRTNNHECRIYPINENYFDIIDTETKSYFLGLLYADGSNSGRGFAIYLSTGDSYILEYLIEQLYSENKPQMKEHLLSEKNPNHSNSTGITVINKHIANQLEKHGCIQNKSLKLCFPQNVPENLLKHFIRGYFDGDGCATYKEKDKLTVGFVGTDMFLHSLQDYLIDIGILSSKTKIYKTSSKNEIIKELKTSKQQDIVKLYNFLYNDSNLCINRKKNKIYEWIKKKGFDKQ